MFEARQVIRARETTLLLLLIPALYSTSTVHGDKQTLLHKQNTQLNPHLPQNTQAKVHDAK